MPYSAALPIPTVTAVGVANPKEHGHATTKIEIKVVKANNNVESNIKYHIQKTAIAITKTTGIK